MLYNTITNNKELNNGYISKSSKKMGCGYY
ncbi:hypothetical protein FHU23_000895 [Clostridium saccharobutylicum]|nr:hypothetical protein CLOSC_11050 [Clostridium saccharobutylicum]AQR99306.1 hypothetical protein CSACC_11130 [Clostridium saccharobutylicum]AQS13292.1 hypothetical protein CLOSACC_11130 [Clostridium saccharobutylicum]MBA2904519.1 hypothetical protein [Clostridium saccharobutylicum]MBA8788857.1 hypothetical protein [Clostridium saccharobutylicum]